MSSYRDITSHENQVTWSCHLITIATKSNYHYHYLIITLFLPLTELQIIRLYNVYPNVSFKNNSGCFAVTHIRRCKEKCEAYEKLGIECNSFEVKPPRSNLVKTMNCCLHKSYVFRKDVIKSRYEDTTTYELIGMSKNNNNILLILFLLCVIN